MKYQKITNLLDDETKNQLSKFRTRNWIEITDESKGQYDNSNKFKTFIIRSNLCDYNDAYLLVKGTITVPNTIAAGTAVNNTNKKIIFNDCAPFTDYITEIINTQVDNAQKIDIEILMYNLIQYSDAYSKISGSLLQYYRDELALDDNHNIIDCPANNNDSAFFKFKQQIT